MRQTEPSATKVGSSDDDRMYEETLPIASCYVPYEATRVFVPHEWTNPSGPTHQNSLTTSGNELRDMLGSSSSPLSPPGHVYSHVYGSHLDSVPEEGEIPPSGNITATHTNNLVCVCACNV